MASLNRVLLIGNLTRDPELRYTTGGTGICGMRLAVHRRYRVDGQEREETCFVDVDAFGRQAETCNQYLSKGSPILVEGRLRYDEWDDRETGRKRSRLQVIAERVQFLPSGDRSGGSQHEGGGQSHADPAATQAVKPAQPQAPTPAAGNPPPKQPTNPSSDSSIDDIPF